MNVDPLELKKFSDSAQRWWDLESEFRPLHEINPLRLEWINSQISLLGKKVLDVGCGGGILAESMSQKGANVTGIDLSDKALEVADLHGLESGLKVCYEKIPVEEMAIRDEGKFDVVTCMEMLEHVPDPASVVQACSSLVKAGGRIFFSTLNRNLKSYLQAILAGEYLLRILPRGTHDYAKFIRPSELGKFSRDAGLVVCAMRGMRYNPLTKVYSLNKDISVNYLISCVKTI
jgi:2-polyprenyl-6-hydroxyphenyl methylase/3-demethylubiquinone-9 3-methyltransferase